MNRNLLSMECKHSKPSIFYSRTTHFSTKIVPQGKKQARKCPFYQALRAFENYSNSIVAGCSHADGIIEKLNYYISKDFNLVLTSHYTPENLKDVKTKIDYLKDLKNIADACTNAEEMKKAVSEKYPEYSGMNYLDMTVGFFFPTKS